MNGSGRFLTIVAAAWLLFVAAVYLPDLGRGFVRDDFGWIEAGRTALTQPRRALLPQTPGFYRPLVTFTFALDYLAYGVTPRGYGFSNLALYVACVAAVWLLARSARVSIVGATVAAFAWAVNPHGINMAVVWISGRTELCLTLFALLAATALLRRRYVLMAVLLTAALASKEEAFVLPAILFAWHSLVGGRDGDGRTRDRLKVAAGLALATLAVLATRWQTAAFTPASAPPFYRFTFAPETVFRNAVEYADRGATIAAIVVLLAFAVLRGPVRLGSDRIRLLAACAIWFAGGFALTVFLPVRSSLYAVFPSVGAALACGVVVESMSEHTAARRADALPLAVALAVALLALVPTYRLRNDRWVEPARLSERALRTIGADAASSPQVMVIILRDANDPMASFASAFGTFASEAVRLRTGRNLQTWIEPPPPDWRAAGLVPPDPRQPRTAFAVERGRVFRVF